MYKYIPQELKNLPQWVCWKSIPDDKGRTKKIPINPHTGGQAQSNNPTTWSDFDTAVAVSSRFTGIGFMFNDNGYFGVDLDGVGEAINKFQNDEDDNIVSEFVHTLQSYTELSQSGEGIHIICKGELPPTGRRSGNVEMYQSGRFFVMTGKICAEYADITDCTKSIKFLHEKYIGGGVEPATVVSQQYANSDLHVNDIIELAKNSKQGQMFSDLYHGAWNRYYNSQSEADMSFCNMLAFWCGCDIDKMDEIYRSSGLMRPKWERRQSKSTYGLITLNKAINDCTNVYEPPIKRDSNYTLSIDSTAPTKPKMYSFDDTGNARRIIDMFGEQIRYFYTDKTWFYYDGRKWCVDLSGAIKRMADVSIEKMKGEAILYKEHDEKNDGDMHKSFLKHAKASRSSRAKTAMIKEAEHIVPLLVSEIDKHEALLNTPNGIIDLRTGDLQPHDSTKYLTKITGTEYTDNADCPLWIKFLDDIFGGDKELMRYIQKAIGYSLSGSTKEQCVFFLYGTGRNGKSTFLEIVREIFGDYATNIQPETIMIRGSNTGANSDIARLKGARFVTSVEPNEGVRINEGLLKQLTGEDLVTARKLYGNEFEFKPEFKLWMATNHKPIIRGTDIGIWRRIHMIPFTVQIPTEKIDRHLVHKLKKELSAIFKWAVDGALLYRSEGLEMPMAVLSAVKEYQSEMDVISAFISACCVAGEGEVKASQLYAVYSRWAEENNEYRMSNTKFGREMAKRYDKKRNTNGIFYSGISLNSDFTAYNMRIG